MPIKPENKARYPKNWKEVRARILKRAGNRCEGSPAYPDCRIANGRFRNNTTGEVTHDPMQFEAWTLADGNKASMIVLTIAHLDHAPENCADANLKAMCQRCHLTYDAKHHAAHAHATRHARKAIGELFA